MPSHPEITAYRPCVGAMLINSEGLVWIGRRFDKQVGQAQRRIVRVPVAGMAIGFEPGRFGLADIHVS